MSESIEAACTKIEANDPPITSMTISCYLNDELQRTYIEVDLTFNQNEFSHFRDDDFDVAVLRRLGRAIGNSHTLQEFVIERYRLEGEVINPISVHCLEALYDEVKYNKSLIHLTLDLFPNNAGENMFDLGYFLGNNDANIRDISLSSMERVSTVQSRIISAAVASAHLKRMSIECCEFENNSSFALVLEACHLLDVLEVSCNENIEFTSVATLLQDHRTIIQRMQIDIPDDDDLDYHLAVGEITASLVGNITLKELVIDIYFYLAESGNEVEYLFSNMLCDPSTVESICNRSNHTIECIHQGELPARVYECLELNHNEDKRKVAQNKVMQYYFIDDFDLGPFENMTISTLPQVMSLGEGMSNKHTAIFRMLRSIPELCNVTNRRVKEVDRSSIRDILCCKRQKIA
eukprot:scaffold22538_cov58-Cyclotella_meneghiniana.AAC.3